MTDDVPREEGRGGDPIAGTTSCHAGMTAQLIRGPVDACISCLLQGR